MEKYNTNKRESSLTEDLAQGTLGGVLFGLAFAVIMLIVGTLGSAIGL